MAVVIKISLVLSGESNALEYHRVLPESYLDGCRVDFFTEEINSLREEAKAKNPDLSGYKEYIRIAAMETDSGKLLP